MQEFVNDLNIKKETFQSAAKATAETATVTVTKTTTLLSIPCDYDSLPPSFPRGRLML